MRRVTTAAMLGAAVLLAGCSSSSDPARSGGSTGTSDGLPVTVSLGFLTNITHAPALVGLKEGLFAKDLGPAGTRNAPPSTTATQETTPLLPGQLYPPYL